MSTRKLVLVGVVGAVGYLGAALVQAADPLRPDATGFASRNIPSAIAALLLVATVVGLARSGVAGNRRAARIGMIAVALGWVTTAAAHVISQLRGEDFPPPYIIATVLQFIGMMLIGVAVLRAGGWTRWPRWVPLGCALYLVSASPSLGLPDAPGHLAVAGWGVCWLVLGLVLLRHPARGVAPVVTPSSTLQP